MAITGWYVLYRTGSVLGFARTDEFRGGDRRCEQHYRDGREVVQIGPLDQDPIRAHLMGPLVKVTPC